MPDTEWYCRAEHMVVPDGERETIGSYRLHRAAAHNLHRVSDGWQVKLDGAGAALVKDGDPQFVDKDIEATEAQ